METEINGIIKGSKVYVAEPKGSRHCFDCDLHEDCLEDYVSFCTNIGAGQGRPIYFRFSPELTDKLKGE